MSLAYSRELGSGWTLMLVDDAELSAPVQTIADLDRYASPKLSAQVPGDWPLDYVRHGLLDDPFFADNYLKLRDYENSHVFYAVRFDFDGEPDGRTCLRFEGIDTVADVFLNGRKIGHAENMYIPHEFFADGLTRGENELLVHIAPTCLEARKYPISAMESAQKYNYESLVIRKAAHMFGWDICPRIVSAGLWRPVTLIQKKAERIDDVFIWVDRLTDDGRARCRAAFDIDIGRNPIKPYELRIEGACGESRFSVSQRLWYVHGRMEFTVENPMLWWPRSYGAPNLYEITVTLLRDGEAVDTHAFRQGLRTVELPHDDVVSDDGAEFCFVVNGKRIFVMGSNWVPADAFHSNDANRIPAILELFRDAGCNALRVWGGGVYENDYFYDWCDENGFIVWQDFMMACGVYPHTERMLSQLKEEATAIVRRLRHHACICVWAGDNECDQNYCWFTDRVDPTGNRLTRGVIPAVLHAHDWSRPYLPSSPYVSPKAFALGMEQQTPEQHLWGPRDYFKGHFYHDHTATFASEMGYHGCNSPQSIRKFIPESHLWPERDNPMWLYHCASPELEGSPYTYRIPLMSGQIRSVFTQEPQNLDQYARMSQICQAEAKKFFIESFRAGKGRRTGLIWWNIMDNWPQFSDAVVDYYFCRKLAYFFIRRSQQPLCLMMDDHGGRLALYAVSELQEAAWLRCRVTDVESGRVVFEGDACASADASTHLWDVHDDGGCHFYLIEWEGAGGLAGRNHYLQGAAPYDFEWYYGCLKKAGFDEFEGF